MYNSPADRYKYDLTFCRMVDAMRAALKEYHFTGSELREAAILAATMHETQNIRPLFIREGMDWGYPAMFGGSVTGRFNSTKSNEGSIPPSLDRRSVAKPKDRRTRTRSESISFRSAARIGKYERFQSLYKAKGADAQTGDRRKPKTHCHVFVGTGRGYSVCEVCGISDTYHNSLAHNRKP